MRRILCRDRGFGMRRRKKLIVPIRSLQFSTNPVFSSLEVAMKITRREAREGVDEAMDLDGDI